MDSYRSVLEVLKCFPVKLTLLSASFVSRSWLLPSASEELWLSYLEDEGLAIDYFIPLHPKALYQKHKQRIASLLFVKNQSITMISVADLSVAKIALPVDTHITDKNAYCFVNPWTAMCVGEAEVCRVNINSLTVTPLQRTLKERVCPGLLRYGSYVYAFGGSQSSIEKYKLQTESWELVAGRFSTRLEAPTPALYAGKVYIANCERVEVFHLPSEFCSVLAIKLPTLW